MVHKWAEFFVEEIFILNVSLFGNFETVPKHARGPISSHSRIPSRYEPHVHKR